MRIFIIILLILLSNFAIAADYYVAKTGSDAADGSVGTPWLTIEYGLSQISASDTLNVNAGDYTAEGRITLDTSGTAGNYTTLKGVSSPVVSMLWIDGDYIKVEGMVVDGSVYEGPTIGVVWVESGADYFWFTDNTCQDFPDNFTYGFWLDWVAAHPTNMLFENNTFTGIDCHMIGLNGSGHIVRNNSFTSDQGWDCIRVSNTTDVLIQSNTFHISNEVENSNHTDIIQAFTSSGETITGVIFERNYCYGGTECQIGMLEDEDLAGNIGDWIFRNNVYNGVEGSIFIYVRDIYWYNNTFYKSGLSTNHPILYRDSVTKGNGINGKVFNNIFIETGNGAEGYYTAETIAAATFTADNNHATTTSWGAISGFSETNGVDGGDPKFVNAIAGANGNFMIGADSVSKDEGTTIAGFSNDYDNNSRVAPWDIGAYEYQDPTQGTFTPTNFNSGKLSTTPKSSGSGLSVTLY